VIKKPEQKILVPGCGNSELSLKLVEMLGQKSVLSVDFEREIIDAMEEAQPDYTKGYLNYEKMDITDMKAVKDE